MTVNEMIQFDANQVAAIVEKSKMVFWECANVQDGRLGLTAGLSGNAYPFIYTRDLSIFIRYLAQTGNLNLARQAVEFLLYTQLPSGEWVQRYNVAGQRKDDKVQEDNTPLAMWAILEYLEKVPEQRQDLRYGETLKKAMEWIALHLDSRWNLLYAHSSNHEDGVNCGFDLWTNSVLVRSLEMLGSLYDNGSARRMAAKVRDSMLANLVHGDRFVRTMGRDGTKQYDADVILLAPFYFEILPANDDRLQASAAFLSDRLQDQELGGFWRYEQDVYLPGPWVLYTAIIARYYFCLGNKEKGEHVLHWVLRQAEDGYLPEHILSSDSFWKYRDHQVNRAERMPIAEMKQARLSEINRLESEAKQGRTLRFAVPLLWSHMETVAAMLETGRIQSFELGEHTLSCASQI